MRGHRDAQREVFPFGDEVTALLRDALDVTPSEASQLVALFDDDASVTDAHWESAGITEPERRAERHGAGAEQVGCDDPRFVTQPLPIHAGPEDERAQHAPSNRSA